MTFVSSTGRSFLFGGFTDSSPFFLGDTWEWDGEEWVQVADTGRSPRVPMLTYDPARNVAVLFGGAEAGGDLFDTWEKASDKTWRADGPVLVSCVQAAPSQAHVPLPPKELAEPLSRTVTCRAASYTMLWDGDAWTQIEDEGPGHRGSPPSTPCGNASSSTACVSLARPRRPTGQSARGKRSCACLWLLASWLVRPWSSGNLQAMLLQAPVFP
jgi:hypothetical protein